MLYFHIYQDIWKPDIDNEFIGEREEGNDCNNYTVTVVGNQGDTRGHDPCDKSSIYLPCISFMVKLLAAKLLKINVFSKHQTIVNTTNKQEFQLFSSL